MLRPTFLGFETAKRGLTAAQKGLDIAVPEHYYPGDDPAQTPIVNWRSAGQLFYTNWLDYYVYQATPYDLRDL